MANIDSPQDQAKLNEQLKSIVYGDVVKNKYGSFRCFCATISDESQIDNVVSYLRRNVSFHRLSKFSYSYRIATYERVTENYRNDARLEGCGEKILHLLQKFNVENVLLVIGVDKKDMFGIISSEYYHTIIERAKDLLSTLYEKVLENDFGVAKEPFITSLQDNMISTNNILRKAASVTNMDSNIIPLPQISRKLERPNHFMTAEQRQKIQSSRGKLPVINNDREKLLQSVLKNNLRRNFEKLRALLDDWQDNDYQHMKFICLYDKMPRISKVFKILMILDDIRSPEELSQTYNFKDRLPQLGNKLLTKEKCKKVSEILRQDKLLTPKALARENPVVASLLEYVAILVRNFELSERIFTLNANNEQMMDKDSYDLQYSKIAFDIEEERNNLVLDLTKDLAYTLKDTQKATYEGAQTIVATTESDQQLLPRAQSHMELKNKTLMLQKESSKVSQDSSQRSTPRKNGAFVAKGMASGSNSHKVDKVESNSISLSEENSHQMEPRFFNQASVAVNKITKAENGYDPKVPQRRISKNKSHDVMPKKSISKPNGVGNENMIMETNKYLSNALKPPGSGSKQSNGKINSNSRTTPQESMSNQALRGFSSELPESTEGNIPDDPEDIRKYLEKNPIDEQPDQNLEEIANKLENHRANI